MDVRYYIVIAVLSWVALQAIFLKIWFSGEESRSSCEQPQQKQIGTPLTVAWLTLRLPPSPSYDSMADITHTYPRTVATLPYAHTPSYGGNLTLRIPHSPLTVP